MGFRDMLATCYYKLILFLETLLLVYIVQVCIHWDQIYNPHPTKEHRNITYIVEPTRNIGGNVCVLFIEPLNCVLSERKFQLWHRILTAYPYHTPFLRVPYPKGAQQNPITKLRILETVFKSYQGHYWCGILTLTDLKRLYFFF